MRAVLACAALVAASSACGQALTDGGFEASPAGALAHWRAYGAYALDVATAHSGRQAIRCDTDESRGASGAMQEIVYAQPDKVPVVFGGWSKAERVAAQDYCVYLDIWYEGGGNAWGVRADWPCRPHGWEYSAEVFCPAKPIRKIQCFVFVRRGAGRVWFDDLFLERRVPALGVKRTQFVSDYPRSQTGLQATLELWKAAAWDARLVDAAGRELEAFSGRGERVAFASEGVGVPASLRLAARAGSETFEEAFALSAFVRPRVATKGGFAVWTADSMRCVTPLTYPTAAEAERPGVELDVARNESESAQILVTADASAPLRGVAVQLPPLVGPGGQRLDGEASWLRVGYVRRQRPFNPHPCGLSEEEGWVPDPLLPAAPADVRAGATQGFWLTVRAGEAAAPGVYTARAAVTSDGRVLREIPVSVRVLGLCNPKTFGMPTAFCVMDGFTRAQYPGRFEEMRRRTYDLMLDHRLNPDDISRTEPPRLEDLLHARERGMNRFNILNLVPKPEKPAKWVCYAELAAYTPAFYEALKARLTPYVAELRRHGLEKGAYLYGFDERPHEYYPAIAELCAKLKVDFPDIPVMTTAMMYRDMRDGKSYPGLDATDWFCPLTSVYDPALSDKLRAAGRQVWWYVCCGPTHPHANFASLEYPFVEGRLLGWLTYRYRADGLLYWLVNQWPDAPPLMTGDTFLAAWQAANSLRMPGDGQLLYPGEEGPLPSIRLANIRDGIEDYEWLALLEQAKGRDAAEAATADVVRGMTDFARSPERLRAARARLADALRRRRRRHGPCAKVRRGGIAAAGSHAPP